MDYSAKVGTEIYATGDGIVSKVKRSKRGYGNYVKINHGFGYETLYAHMSKYIVKKGHKKLMEERLLAMLGILVFLLLLTFIMKFVKTIKKLIQ